jgi:hypothetical protein
MRHNRNSIAATISTAAAPLAANATQLPSTTSGGTVTHDVRSGFVGWSVAELAVHNRYRVSAR